MDSELSDAECYGCSRGLRVRSDHGTHATKAERPHEAYRCYVCGRLFCPDCAADHFGEDPP